jgi:hypothetical protein
LPIDSVADEGARRNRTCAEQTIRQTGPSFLSPTGSNVRPPSHAWLSLRFFFPSASCKICHACEPILSVRIHDAARHDDGPKGALPTSTIGLVRPNEAELRLAVHCGEINDGRLKAMTSEMIA